MKAIQKSTKVSNVITACITVAAATITLGYVLMPTSAEAADDNTTINEVPTMPAHIDQSIIGDNVMARASGAIAVNMAAGNMNQQANAAALAYNPQGVATAQSVILQSSTKNLGPMVDVATTIIEGNAFANVSGMIAINQVSGFANSQANSMAIAMGIQGEVTPDSVLAGTAPNAAGLVPGGEDLASRRDVSISETAFQNASGVVQLNQTAGSCNDSANNFTLRLSEAP